MNHRYLLPLFLVATSFFSTNSCADGPPIDPETGQITCEHELVKLTTSQKEEIVSLGTLTLSDTQWETIRKTLPGYPKRIDYILDKRYRDCMCGVDGAYAVQVDENSVAIPSYAYEDNFFPHAIAQTPEHMSLTIDSRGQFYYGGALLRYPLLKTTLAALESAEGEHLAQIKLPFGTTEETTALASRLTEVRALFEAKGWECAIN